VYNEGYWQRRFRRYRVFVAESRGQVVGFAELDGRGHVDCFYVHHAWQRKGIGAALMTRVLSEARRAGVRRLHADVSTTARPFFIRMGYGVDRVQKTIYRGQPFRQYRMSRSVS
jgi:putative acetyltransferase